MERDFHGNFVDETIKATLCVAPDRQACIIYYT